jgi:hypothetical protein
MSLNIRKAQLQDEEALTDILKSLGWFAHLASEPADASRHIKRKFYEMQGWQERTEIANFVYVLK